MKDFISAIWPAALGAGIVLVIQQLEPSDRTLLIILGFLSVGGFVLLHEKLSKNILKPRGVPVEVRYKIELRDDDLEFKFLEKIIRFPVVPRIGDQVSDFGSLFLNKVTAVRLSGDGDGVDGTPEATVWCEGQVGSIEKMQEIADGLKEDGWRDGFG